MSRGLSNKRKSIIFLTLAMVGVLGVVLILNMRVAKKINELVIEEEIFLFFENEKFEFNSELVLNRNKDITSIKVDGQEVNLDSEPIYIKNKDEVIFPSTMSLILPLEGVVQKKVNYFSKVKIIDDEVLLDTNGLKNYPLSKAFLYDGQDLYFFTEDVVLIVDDKKISVPAFSYVVCRLDGNLYVFNYKTGEMVTYENNKKNVKVTDGEYVVNLSYDLVEFNDNSILLVKNVKQLLSFVRGD